MRVDGGIVSLGKVLDIIIGFDDLLIEVKVESLEYFGIVYCIVKLFCGKIVKIVCFVDVDKDGSFEKIFVGIGGFLKFFLLSFEVCEFVGILLVCYNVVDDYLLLYFVLGF